MNPQNDRDRNAFETWRGSWRFLAFGLCVLAYLIAIERPEWFVPRAATGTVIALAAAPAPVSDPAKP